MHPQVKCCQCAVTEAKKNGTELKWTYTETAGRHRGHKDIWREYVQLKLSQHSTLTQIRQHSSNTVLL